MANDTHLILEEGESDMNPSLQPPYYVQAIRNALENKQQKLRAYSLRAFARDLNLSPGYLCSILSQKKMMSPHSAAKVVQKLNLPSDDVAKFMQSATESKGDASTHLRNDLKKSSHASILETPNTPAQPTKPLSKTLLAMITDWYHSALLQLTEVQGFRWDPQWISKRMGISRAQVTEVTERLTHLGLLKQNAQGILERISGHLEVPPGANDAIRQFHASMLLKAMEALNAQKMRQISSVTLSFDTRKIPEVKRLTTQFMKEILALSETEEKDSVYHLAIQFFRLDKDMT